MNEKFSREEKILEEIGQKLKDFVTHEQGSLELEGFLTKASTFYANRSHLEEALDTSGLAYLFASDTDRLDRAIIERAVLKNPELIEALPKEILEDTAFIEHLIGEIKEENRRFIP